MGKALSSAWNLWGGLWKHMRKSLLPRLQRPAFSLQWEWQAQATIFSINCQKALRWGIRPQALSGKHTGFLQGGQAADVYHRGRSVQVLVGIAGRRFGLEAVLPSSAALASRTRNGLTSYNVGHRA